jgi:hypothetical protein
MQNSKDHNRLSFNLIENPIWKPPREETSKAAVVDWMSFRRLFQQSNGLADLTNEGITQARSFVVIPGFCLPKVRFGTRPNDDTPIH